MKVFTAVLMIMLVTSVVALPLSNSKTLVITPNNLRSVSKFVDNSVTIGTNVITVSTGTSRETLFQVPLAGAGEIDPQATIRITAGFDSDQVDTSTYVRVGISDGGGYYNQFYVYGTSSTYACAPYSTSSTESNRANEGTLYYPGEVTMLFQPFYKYGSCATGHDGGHVNVGTFSSTVDLSKGVSLQVNRHLSSDRYRIYYFVVEIL